MSDLELDDVVLTGIEDYPPMASVKLHGPPGTGKTTQSAARVAKILNDDENDYDISNVAWVTYRQSLAKDTLRRLATWGVIDNTELEQPHRGKTRMIGTIHAIANRCCADLPDPVEDWMKNDFCQRVGIKYWGGAPWEDTVGEQLFTVWSWCRTNLLDPSNPEHIRKCPHADDLLNGWHGDVCGLYEKWEDYKAERGVIDFWEMLTSALEMGVVPTRDILVVDEFHDATPLINATVKMWMEAADTVIVAGDPHQVVNSYDGADPRFFEQVELPKVLLDKTYRVGEEHWRAATALLSNAHDAPPVELTGSARITEYRSPSFDYSRDTGWAVPHPEQEAGPAQLAEQADDSILFLARTTMQADGVGAALERAGIPYYAKSDMNGWNNDDDRLHLYNALTKLRGFAPEHFDSVGMGLERYMKAPNGKNPEDTRLSAEEASTLLKYVSATDLAQSRSDTDELRDEIEADDKHIPVSDLKEYVTVDFWSHYTAGHHSVDHLLKGSLKDRDRIALQAALKRNDTVISPNTLKVGVLTIHASKGKEAKDVVVYDGISKRVRRAMEGSERERKNEWRTWYVALSRADNHLHIMRGGFRWTSSIIPENIRDIASRGDNHENGGDAA